MRLPGPKPPPSFQSRGTEKAPTRSWPPSSSPYVFPSPLLPNTCLPPPTAQSPTYLKDGVADGRFKQHQHGEDGSGRCAARRRALVSVKKDQICGPQRPATPRLAKHQGAHLPAKNQITLPKRSTLHYKQNAWTRERASPSPRFLGYDLTSARWRAA